MLVADEDNAAYARCRAFVHFKDQVNAVLAQLHRLGFNLSGEPTRAAINFKHALNVRLNLRAREHHAWLQLDFIFERLAGNLGVTVERDAVDDRILNDLHRHDAVGLLDLNVSKEAGREQRLQRLVDLRLRIGLTFLDHHIGDDRGFLDALIAFNDYALNS